MPKLDGKIAVITGGNSGIGLATAKVFVKKGARVYITGRRQPELEAAAVLLGPNATPVQGDVSKPADLDRLYGQIRKEVGRVDVVFANAGLVTKAPLGSLTEEHVEKLLRLKQDGQALDAAVHRLRQDPSFRPKTAADTLRIATLAAQGGGARSAARTLLSDFAQRFKEDPSRAAAEALAKQLAD